MIESFFSSGYAADAVILVLAIEAVWLKSRGWNWTAIAKPLGSAVFIVLAVRAALVGAPWYWIALALMTSFPFHALDLRDRLGDRVHAAKAEGS
ncbi:MAG: hypothetical protein QNI87_13845 [Erythrobacter sp.]|uniref:hypothetical protein n=1 Tax=Erythrobacter sp. TaxID=1042 RepID=UPI002605E259|nr:hypothetical protein [Erythrobacter sp.]MDJ0979603.1 hypothetical protein [Erythrobacter sp.]